MKYHKSLNTLYINTFTVLSNDPVAILSLFYQFKNIELLVHDDIHFFKKKIKIFNKFYFIVMYCFVLKKKSLLNGIGTKKVNSMLLYKLRFYDLIILVFLLQFQYPIFYTSYHSFPL